MVRTTVRLGISSAAMRIIVRAANGLLSAILLTSLLEGRSGLDIMFLWSTGIDLVLACPHLSLCILIQHAPIKSCLLLSAASLSELTSPKTTRVRPINRALAPRSRQPFISA